MFVSSGACGDSRANALCKQLGLQGRVMWFDAEANIWELSTRRGVADMVSKCKSANINTIVVDVNPLSGLVLYRSKIAPKLVRFRGRAYPRKYDLLRTVLEEAHKVGIAVHAGINVLSQGSRTQSGGPAHKHTDWQCVKYEMQRALSTEDAPDFTVKCSPDPRSDEEIGIYGEGGERTGKLPANTIYARVTHEGRPLGWGVASGCARLSAPPGGYLLVASGKAGQWLKETAESGARYRLEGRGVLVRVGEADNAHNAVFVNPLHPEARAHALGVIKEICSNYPIDGLMLDRLRYPDIYTDFSDLTRHAFESCILQRVVNWPEDVLSIDVVPRSDIVRGPLFKDWLKFRAEVIRNFLSEARDVVNAERPGARLGIYVGSWYPLYYDVGVNWGSPNHSTDFEWWPDGYEQTGYADLVDYICTGCYYAHPTRQDALAHGDEQWKSVEAAAEESINAVRGDTFVYASLYVRQYRGRPQKFSEAIRQCLNKTQGCMVFDLVYVRDYDWWHILKDAFPTSAKTPHDVPGLAGRIRSKTVQKAQSD